MKLQSSRLDERGMTTAEYSVGSLGACVVAAVLVRLTQGEWFQDLFSSIIRSALDPLRLVELVRDGLPFTPLRGR
ncbi:hypothetical protein ASD11_00125 [Aeromicrobium sp. Root495]|uniref:DUF4244 domain-containing protein n=1 Tax=Aeromicrobium sp. Root495 TaxID=1736550 RepID=UPI0006FCFBC1|nr:DUF4244 domain-containing protein [Aeromicrobium sp. Root495]KQY58119.1 hypothetical protein ASD11_00125 [Aeromicrobium sp. Root495]RYJ07629.1 MAG: DUF4244 domain-containing protein [Actinomycetales bacterium]